MQNHYSNDTIGQGATTAKPASAKDKAEEFVKDTAARAGDVASDIKDSVSEAASDIGSRVAEGADRTQREALRKVAEGTEHTVEQGKSYGRELLLSLSRAFDAGSKSLEDDGMPASASYARATSKGLENAAEEIEGLDSGGVAHRVESFVRDRPFQTVGLFAVAGFALATVIKASTRPSDDRADDES